mmetsp:Transcript_23884/g.29385  ORF Transcript_23884/g.29385 Transcript_23884/m.29385 type:complete len:363 (+) Transcript_23884:80-1168(+)
MMLCCCFKKENVEVKSDTVYSNESKQIRKSNSFSEKIGKDSLTVFRDDGVQEVESASSSKHGSNEDVEIINISTGNDGETESKNKLLAHPKHWPSRPIYIQAVEDTNCIGILHNDDPLPIGTPIDFETSIFKGKILIRIRDTNKTGRDDEYFVNRKRKRQYVIQGQFKEAMKMSEIYFGDCYEKPLKLVPPPAINRLLKKAFRKLVPGIVMDLTSNKPKVIALLAGTAQNLSIDKVGFEPDMAQLNLPECTKLIVGQEDIFINSTDLSNDASSVAFKSKNLRKKVLSNPTNASQYSYVPNLVYTFELYDDIVDLTKYTMKLVVGNMNMSKILGSQPTTIYAGTLDKRSMLNFKVFHECHIEN